MFAVRSSFGGTAGSVVARLTASGSLFLDGGVNAAKGFHTGAGADLAEEFNVLDEAGPGDIVSTSSGVDVTRSTVPYDGTVVGVIAGQPGLRLTLSSGDSSSDLFNPRPVALAGRVPVNVTNEGGLIEVGDYITTSSTPGHGMRATQAGHVIGMALESFNGIKGQVLMKVVNTWWTPSSEGGTLSALAGTSGTLTELKAGTASFTGLVATIASVANLDVGTAVFDSLMATEGTFGNLAVSRGTINLLEAVSGSFEELQAVSGQFKSVEATSGAFSNLVVIDGSFETLVADSATFGTLEATEGLTVGEGGDTATITRHLSAVAALDFYLPANSCQDLTMLVEGAGTDGDTVAVGAPSTLGPGLSVTGFVSGLNTVAVRACNPTAKAQDPGTESYRVDVWQHQ